MTDHLATIDSLRPDPVDMDPAWADATLAVILAEQSRPETSRRRPRSRTALVSLAVVVTSAVGGGVAVAATDAARTSFVDAFAFWRTGQDGSSGDPAQARRVASAPGPEGTVFSVISTTGDPACRTAVLESSASAAQALPTSFVDVTSNWCSAASDGGAFGSPDVSFQDGVAGFIVVAGRADRASVRTEDGHEYPALLADGHFWGWFPEDEHPTLVGYAPDGSVVGRIDLGTGTASSQPPQSVQSPD